MLIKILTNNNSFYLNDLTKGNTIDDLKSSILKKFGKKYSYDKLILKTKQGKKLNPNKTLGENNIYDGMDIMLTYPLKAFTEIRPKINGEYLDINTFILDTVQINEIVFFSWGNFISNPIVMKESKSRRYNNWHNVFRQQLPIPILEHASNFNKNINFYSVDIGFESRIEYDIRRILEKFVKPIIIDDVELFVINTCELLQELEINCEPSQSICNFYFFKHTYGFCNRNKSLEDANIDLCINELKDDLNKNGIEYYIYKRPLDINTLITNNNNIGNKIKGWFKMDGGKKNKKKKKLTMRHHKGGMESNRLPTPPRTLPPISSRQNRSSNNDIFGANMIDLFNNDENYLFPDNPRNNIDFSQLDDINQDDIPLEAMKIIEENLDFDNCEDFRNYCIINPRICSFDEQFKKKYEKDLRKCKAKSNINKSIKTFYSTEINPKLLEVLKQSSFSNRGNQFYNTIEYKMPFPSFIGKMFKEYIRDQGILNKISSQKLLGGQINVSMSDVAIYFRMNDPEILKNMLKIITHEVIETKKNY